MTEADGRAHAGGRQRWYVAGLALLGALAALGVRGDAPRTLAFPPHPRVLVFSPHPDDETIAAGGLIRRFARQGASVRVVFVTNGDGYPEAVEEDLDRPKPTDDDYVAFGKLRQREALRAARHLGLTKHDVSFLGFPDGGIAALWEAHWSRARPYTSPYTQEDRPPYSHAENPHVEYDGQDLTKVIGRLLADFRPSVVIMPHPYDRHPDHQYTSYFVTEALSSRRDLLPRDLVVLTYLVHYPAWPAKRAPAFDRLVPDTRVPFTAWRETGLAPDELVAKRAALAEYKTQLEVMNGFLQSFLCRNELFGDVDGTVLARIASVH